MSLSLIFFFAALACLAGVVLSLAGGVAAMTRGGEKDHRTSNRMMRLRILLQGLAVAFLLLSWLSRA